MMQEIILMEKLNKNNHFIPDIFSNLQSYVALTFLYFTDLNVPSWLLQFRCSEEHPLHTSL